MKRMILTAIVAAAAMILPAAAANAGVTGPAIYVDGDLYRTVGTPTDFSATGAPAQAFDTIYQFFGAQANVATAAPGDPGFTGGRWEVHGLSFNTSYAVTLAAHDTDGDGVLDSAAEVWSALEDAGAGGASDMGVIKRFECPVIHVPGS
jgi:hypothetical protein